MRKKTSDWCGEGFGFETELKQHGSGNVKGHFWNNFLEIRDLLLLLVVCCGLWFVGVVVVVVGCGFGCGCCCCCCARHRQGYSTHIYVKLEGFRCQAQPTYNSASPLMQAGPVPGDKGLKDLNLAMTEE